MAFQSLFLQEKLISCVTCFLIKIYSSAFLCSMLRLQVNFFRYSLGNANQHGISNTFSTGENNIMCEFWIMGCFQSQMNILRFRPYAHAMNLPQPNTKVHLACVYILHMYINTHFHNSKLCNYGSHWDCICTNL